jgi:hypothetical protein
MRLALTIATVSLLTASCSSSLPEESFRNSVTERASSGTLITEEEIENDHTPTTIDSLEPAITKKSLMYQSLSGGVLIGDNDAPRLTVLSDYGCEYCRDFAMNQLLVIEDIFVKQGLLSVELLFVPRTDAGTLMAKAALCAERQGNFESAHLLLSTQPLTSSKELPLFAKNAKLDEKKLTQCMANTSLDAELFLSTEKANGSRVPFFTLGENSWVGLKQTDALVKEIETYLQR